MDGLIRRWMTVEPRGWLTPLTVACASLAAATLLRVALRIWLPVGVPYITYFPILLVAGLIGGLRAGVLTLFGAMILGTAFFVEAQAHWPPPQSSWIGMVAFLVSGGLIVGLTHVVATAIRALNDANRQERLLVLELQHRVKNTLAIIQAISGQTFGTRGEAVDAFTGRLVALGRAHNVLSEAGWREVTMRALVERSAEPFIAPELGRVTLSGDDLKLGPDLIVDLALCLHELGVNALKHGALSAPNGRVRIAWRRLDDGRVELAWTEHDGPPPPPATHRGFGSRLLEQGLSRKVRPAVVTDLRPEGLRWIAQFDAA